jgi:hypothetical protein
MSSFGLKILALVLMLTDHIHQFLWFLDVPMVFTWLGRISAPLFFFCMAEGMYHTRSRKKYLIRMYLCYLGMHFGNLLLVRLVPNSPNDLPNNIFGTMLLGAVIITCMEEIAKNRDVGQKLWAYFLGAELASFFISERLAGAGYHLASDLLGAFIPTPFTVEGGIVFVMLGPLFYFFRYSKKKTAVMYSLFSLGLFGFAALMQYLGGLSFYAAFFSNGYQWMMIFALPFIWLYNGKKGRSMKALFYVFYPLHIWILYALGTWLYH